MLSRSALHYDFPTNILIHRAKTEGHPPSLQLLADLFVRRFQEEIEQRKPEILIPIPLHRERQQQRGFNQSLELAQRIGKLLAIPVETGLCQRVRATPHQQGLSARQRRTNLRSAFEAKASMAEHIALVDDVITTGSTVEATAKALLRACTPHQRLQIEAWSIARTPFNEER